MQKQNQEQKQILSMQTYSQPSGSTIKILISSDNHLGYKENHTVRGDDSFNAFREVLEKAKQEQVDLVLLGGDLFHEQNPSLNTLSKTVQIFQDNVLGDNSIQFDLYNYKPNYEDSNINIDLPIFIINGNHDYPMDGCGDQSVLDLFHSAKYINYFGKSILSQSIKVKPLLFHKEIINPKTGQVKKTKVAVYGIGNQKETRLNKLFEDNKIVFEKPKDSEDYFNILVVHQNRFKGTKFGASYKQTIQEKLFPNFFNLVIWGHEHECIGEFEESTEFNYKIYQPGSTVITSLIEGEMKPKGYGILCIDENNYSFEQKYLVQNFRPFYFQSISLPSLIKMREQNGQTILNHEEVCVQIIEEKIKNMLEQYQEEYEDLSKTLPLIRIKVDYSELDLIRVNQIEQRYVQNVANPGEILKLHRIKKAQQNFDTSEYNNINEKFIQEILDKKNTFNDTYQDIVVNFANNISKFNPKLFSGEIVVDLLKKINMKQRSELIDSEFGQIMKQVEKVINNEQREKNKFMSQKQDAKMGLIFSEIEQNLQLGPTKEQNMSFDDIQQAKQYNIELNASDRISNFQLQLRSQINDAVSQIYKNRGIYTQNPQLEEQQEMEEDQQDKQDTRTIQKMDDLDFSEDELDNLGQQQQFKSNNTKKQNQNQTSENGMSKANVIKNKNSTKAGKANKKSGKCQNQQQQNNIQEMEEEEEQEGSKDNDLEEESISNLQQQQIHQAKPLKPLTGNKRFSNMSQKNNNKQQTSSKSSQGNQNILDMFKNISDKKKKF